MTSGAVMSWDVIRCDETVISGGVRCGVVMSGE